MYLVGVTKKIIKFNEDNNVLSASFENPIDIAWRTGTSFDIMTATHLVIRVARFCNWKQIAIGVIGYTDIEISLNIFSYYIDLNN